MAIVVAGTILVLVLVAVLVCMRRQRPGPERSRVVVNPLSAPPQQEQAQALVAALAQSDTALLWSALDSADSPLPPPPVVEGPGVAQARARLQAGALSGQALPRRPQLLPQLMRALNDPTSTASKLAGIIG